MLTNECSALQPATQLRRYVERYVYIDTPIPAQIVKPLSPRPESGISFNLQFRNPLRLEYTSGPTDAHPVMAVFGPISHRFVDIRCPGRYRAFNILFKGTGYYRLFQTSPAELADRVSDACDAIGPAIARVHEQLCVASSVTEMAGIVDSYLLARLKREETHPVHELVERVVESQGCARLCRLTACMGLSERQTERIFLEQVGISAKRYAKLTRFRNAVRIKAQNQSLSWADVSQAAGFYDQNHMIKDFRELVDLTPSDYLRSIALAPETELWGPPADGLDETLTGCRAYGREHPTTARPEPSSARRKSTISYPYRA